MSSSAGAGCAPDFAVLDRGGVIDGTSDRPGAAFFRNMLDRASGNRSKSALHGYGRNEFVPCGRPARSSERAAPVAGRVPRICRPLIQSGICLVILAIGSYEMHQTRA